MFLNLEMSVNYIILYTRLNNFLFDCSELIEEIAGKCPGLSDLRMKSNYVGIFRPMEIYR